LIFSVIWIAFELNARGIGGLFGVPGTYQIIRYWKDRRSRIV